LRHLIVVVKVLLLVVLQVYYLLQYSKKKQKIDKHSLSEEKKTYVSEKVSYIMPTKKKCIA
jgi:hypothetical protein